VRETIVKKGFETAYKPPREFASLIRAESAMWRKVIRQANIKAQ
jgi:tripartite-type tricarboxylate transporter receptor subunit TctC